MVFHPIFGGLAAPKLKASILAGTGPGGGTGDAFYSRNRLIPSAEIGI